MNEWIVKQNAMESCPVATHSSTGEVLACDQVYCSTSRGIWTEYNYMRNAMIKSAAI